MVNHTDETNIVPLSQRYHALRTTGLLSQLEELANDTEFMIKFSHLTHILHQTAILKGWWDEGQQKSPGEQVLMMHTELSEAVEALRIPNTLPTDKWYREEDGKPEGFGVELADCVIRIADTCRYTGIDLLVDILEKARFNLSRPHRHGDKTL
jgi:NTP pyrophosphatase (non-canonical NTP hydrolase)